jgi:manganese/zinc/iron transport system substrate-binding protein
MRALLLIICSFLLVFPSCSQKADKAAKLPYVLCTTQMIADATRAIGGDVIETEILIQGAIDPHSYQLVKGDKERIDEAAVVFYNGLNLEHGPSLKAALVSHPQSIALGDAIYQKHPNKILKVEGEVDPHIWMDVSIWVEIIDPIFEQLTKTFPEHQALFEKNAIALKKRWLELDSSIYSKLQAIPENKRYLVTSHDAFNYFSRRYLSQDNEKDSEKWKLRFKAPEGLSPEGQIGPYDLKMILDHLKTYEIQVVFPESNVSIDSLKKIVAVAKQQGIKVRFSRDALFGDSMSGEEIAATCYEEMMEHNCSVIAKNLSQDFSNS